MKRIAAIALALSLGCGSALPPPETVREWAVAGATILDAMVELTAAVLGLVERIQAESKCAPADGHHD